MTTLQSPFPPVPAVAHVTQMRAADPNFVGIFVEGEDDVEMWQRWLKHRPLPRGGCKAVRDAIEQVRIKGISGCVGIVDSDLARHRGEFTPDNDILVSYGNDHECDLVYSPAFDALIASFPNSGPTLSKLATPHANLRDALWSRALIFGVLRWIFRDHGIEFPKQLTPGNENFVDRRTWELDRDKLLDTAAAILSISRNDLESHIKNRSVSTADEWKICNGHDVMSLLRLAFATEKDAANRCKSEKAVGWALRLSLDSKHLAEFPLWQQLVNWERNNFPYIARRPDAI